MIMGFIEGVEKKERIKMTYTQAKKCLQDTDKDTLKDLIERFGDDLVWNYLDNGYSLDDMEEAYQGEYSNDEEFTEQLLEDIGDMPKDFPPYIHIDWEKTAHDIMMDYFEIDGHYFRIL
jgi:hypothetical protein